jgi:protocatechuate 3,4-dioxygenase beta subunit
MDVTMVESDPKATLSGTVRNSSGVPLAGVEVTLGTSNVTHTDLNGYFHYDNLVPGNYNIHFVLAGYQTVGF